MALVAAHLMLSHSGGDNVAIGIYTLPLPQPHNTPSPSPVSTIGLRVSVDVKHHVYKGGGGGGERREIIDVNNCFCGAITLVKTLDLLRG